MVPLMLSRTGAVKHSPSGIFRSPEQGMTGMSVIENLRSVPGAVMCTSEAASMRAFNGLRSSAILA